MVDLLPPGHKIYTVTMDEWTTVVVAAISGEKGDGSHS